MFGRARPHPGEIALAAALPNLPNNAWEIARFWVSTERSFVAIGRLERWSPELLRSLLVESLHTAAATYAGGGSMSEAEALQRLWRGLDEERQRLSSPDSSEDLH
jgi:hypothetical protein